MRESEMFNGHYYTDEGMARAETMRLKRDPTSPYRVECRWWSRHLAYCEALPEATGATWLDTVEAWSVDVASLGYGDALDEIARLRDERRR